ncbi:hypothetical protein PGT21_035474 [Puccinia graminis f. sp. tritici]|uniref:Secreted protein n=1 Tax=Puccinia graminis f. sp. tritici TaxID=56615 RepID=A0A5B0QDI5_PUCGR|nr:hypothetical protein PGT21_035474 [Puccinia graminis f. sp. tritici]
MNIINIVAPIALFSQLFAMNIPAEDSAPVFDSQTGVQIVKATGPSPDAPPNCPHCKKHTHKYCGPPNGPNDPNANPGN